MFTLKKIFSPGSRNLGAQIRCAQNRYTAVQMDLKYPLLTDIKVTLLRWGVLTPCDIIKCKSHLSVLQELFYLNSSSRFS